MIIPFVGGKRGSMLRFEKLPSVSTQHECSTISPIVNGLAYYCFENLIRSTDVTITPIAQVESEDIGLINEYQVIVNCEMDIITASLKFYSISDKRVHVDFESESKGMFLFELQMNEFDNYQPSISPVYQSFHDYLFELIRAYSSSMYIVKHACGANYRIAKREMEKVKPPRVFWWSKWFLPKSEYTELFSSWETNVKASVFSEYNQWRLKYLKLIEEIEYLLTSYKQVVESFKFSGSETMIDNMEKMLVPFTPEDMENRVETLMSK